MKIFGIQIGNSNPETVRVEPTIIQPEPTIKDVGTLINPSASLMWNQGYFPSNTGEQVSHLSALQHSAVYACVRALASDIARLPIHLRANLWPGTKVLRKHPMSVLLQEPNPWQNPFDFLSYLVTSMQLRGNGYCWIRRNAAGEPIELIPLHPDRVQVQRNLELYGRLIYRFTSAVYPSEQFTVDQEDMIHVRNCMALDDGGALGVSPIAMGQNVIALALAVNKSAATLFKQGAQLRGVLQAPSGINSSPEAIQRMASSWEQAYSGNENAHKVALLEGGITYQSISMDAKDAQMLEAREASVVDICRLFKVPPHKVQSLDRATFSNIESESQSYVDNTLIPIAVAIEQEFRRKLLFKSERIDLEFRFVFDEMLRADRKSRMEANQIEFLNGALSQNEWRQSEGRNPIGPEGDVFHLPLNVLPPDAKPTDTTPEAPEAGTPDASGDDIESDDT